MIASLRGVLLEKHPNQAIIETGGVGYDVTIPVSTFSHLPDAGAGVTLRIHTHVREDAIALFGFLTQDEKAIFEKLIGVSGIGPKMGVALLSTFYGVFACYAIFTPIAKKLDRKHRHEVLYRQMIVKGIIWLQTGDSPRSIEAKLRSFLREKRG